MPESSDEGKKSVAILKKDCTVHLWTGTKNPVVKSAQGERSKKVTKFGQWIQMKSVVREGKENYCDKSATENKWIIIQLSFRIRILL